MATASTPEDRLAMPPTTSDSERKPGVRAATVTTVSWIPSESVSGPGRLGFEAGFGLHYDDPPPAGLSADYLGDRARFRLVDRLAAWVEVREGAIVDAGYADASRTDLGVTAVSLGRRRLELVNVALPDIRRDAVRRATSVEFVQTGGGRTAIPFPRRVRGAPHVQFLAPIIWTTISLTMFADGTTESGLVGASAFPRTLGLRRARASRGQGRAGRFPGVDAVVVRGEHSLAGPGPRGAGDHGGDGSGADVVGADHARRPASTSPAAADG